MGAGLFVHCGRFRPKWLKSKRSHTVLTFSFSMEVPMGAEVEAEEGLRESIMESVMSWSRSFRVKMLKKNKERKKRYGHD